jgi:catechol 2,3-dioxygenase-like lactoylglutathione lyase family enzyme
VLNQINIVVRDMAAMTDFYQRLGVELAPTLPEWERHHRSAVTAGGLDLDFDSQAFAAQWDKGWTSDRTGVVIGFRVETRALVDETYETLCGAGHSGQQSPYDAFWGARYAVVADPDGNAVGIMSPIDPERTWGPPTPPR